MGIQDAHNLGWKLALTVCGQAAPGLLDSYDAERRPVAATVVASGDQAEERIAARDPAVRQDMIAMLATPEGNHGAAVADAELALGYGDSPIIAGDPAAADPDATPPGGHLGDVAGLETRSGARRLYDLLRAPAHTLFIPAGDAPVAPCLDLAAAIAERFAPNLEVHVVTRNGARGGLRDRDGALHRRLGVAGPGLCAVRPDGYLGFRAAGLAPEPLEAYLRKILAIPAG